MSGDDWKTLRVPPEAYEKAKAQKETNGWTWGEQIVREVKRPSSEGDVFRAEKRNGVYCLGIHNEYEGYTLHSAHDTTWVQTVVINGYHVGVSDEFEIECNDFVIEDDKLNLICPLD